MYLHGKNSKSTYLKILWFVMASSAIVYIEPSPVDLGIIFLLILGILFSKIIVLKNTTFPNVFIYIFLIGNVLSMFSTTDKSRATFYLLITIYLILSWYLFIGVINKYQDKAIKTIFSGYTFAALYSCLLTIVAYFKTFVPNRDFLLRYGRLTGFFKDPNVFGPFMVPITILSFSKILDKNNGMSKRKRLFWIFMFVLTSSGVLLSYSRAAWGNYIAALGIFIFLRMLIKPTKSFIIKNTILLILLGFGLSYIISLPQVQTMFYHRFAYQEYDNERFSIQDQALETSLKTPLGIGPDHSVLVLGRGTHNTYLRVWVENGVIGLLGFLCFIIFTCFRALKNYYIYKDDVSLLVLASLVGILINSLVIDTLHWRHFWLLLALPWAVGYYKSLNKAG